MPEDVNFGEVSNSQPSMEEMLAHDSHQYIAFILDGVVQYVLGTDILFSAVIQSEPTIKDITMRQNRYSISVGTVYDEETDTFTTENRLF
jgi:hypothetical protein